MREQKPEDRIKNFKEVPFGYNEEEALKEAGPRVWEQNPSFPSQTQDPDNCF